MSYHGGGIGQATVSRGSIEEMVGPVGECLDPSTFRDVRLCSSTPNGPGCEWIQSDPGQLSLMMGLPECGAPLTGLGVAPHLALVAVAGGVGADDTKPGAGKVLVAVTLAAAVVAATLWLGPKIVGAR